MVRKGEPWGEASDRPADLSVSGDDAALARAVADHPGARLAWTPTDDADFARAVGADRGEGSGWLLPCDALRVRAHTAARADEAQFAVNAVVVGTAPDRLRRRTRSRQVRVIADGRLVHEGPATTVLVANGEFVHGTDVVPRGHPGDGRVEVQVYAVRPSQRLLVRERLATGAHVPHPAIQQTIARVVDVELAAGDWPLEVDGRAATARVTGVHVEVVPEAFALVV